MIPTEQLAAYSAIMGQVRSVQLLLQGLELGEQEMAV